jgi:5-methylcytosine-specific restriction endonuclease McrA
MSEVLNRPTVLVLNRNWQAIRITCPAEAFCQMANDSATGLDVAGPEHMVPTPWKDWIHLPVRGDEPSIGTPNGRIRVPTIVVLSRFDKVPMKRPRLNARSLWIRDRGRCQYTGKLLAPGEGNIDHVLPRSRGGATVWENCVLSDKAVNSRKGARTPQEAGLKLLSRPQAPPTVPVTLLLRNRDDIADWVPFLGE